MSISNGDIIQAALDIITKNRPTCRVTVMTRGGSPVVWWGTLTGLGSQGNDATITVTDIRASAFDSPVVPGHILLDVNDVLELIPA
jgi:hypothetical protein